MACFHCFRKAHSFCLLLRDGADDRDGRGLCTRGYLSSNASWSLRMTALVQVFLRMVDHRWARNYPWHSAVAR